MFRRRTLLFASLLLPLMALGVDTSDPDPRVVAELCRYLRANLFGDQVQAGMRKQISERGLHDKRFDRILAAKPEEIEIAVAPILARHVTFEQAHAMAEFYTSALMKRVGEQRFESFVAGEHPPAVSAEEFAVIENFVNSPTGQLATKFTKDPAIQAEYFPVLARKFGLAP